MLQVRLHGDDLDPVRDTERLTAQQQRVYAVMADGLWRTADEVARLSSQRFRTRDGEASVSRQIRYLRARGYTVERKHVSGGLYEYRLVLRQQQEIVGW